MNILISVFKRTIVPVLIILALFITVANAQSTKTVLATAIASQNEIANQKSDTNGCNIPAMPSYSSLLANAKLPDPFKFMNGSYVKTLADWKCRRAEIATLAQEFEYGYKPNTPYSATTGTFTSNSITVTIIDNGDTISFSCSISYPSKGSAPYPAMIGVGGSSLNNSILSILGVAVITFPNDQIAQQIDASSRGKGKFYDMYGNNHSAGALMAWAWGVDRLDRCNRKNSCSEY